MDTFELPWKKDTSVNDKLLKLHWDKMAKLAAATDTFVVELPISVFKHIRSEGVNAELTKFPDKASPGMIWVKVKKSWL